MAPTRITLELGEVGPIAREALRIQLEDDRAIADKLRVAGIDVTKFLTSTSNAIAAALYARSEELNPTD